MDRLVSRATTKDNVIVFPTSPDNSATLAKKTFTIIRFVNLAIVTQAVLLQDSMAAVPSLSPKASCVSARKEFKEEFAINAAHSTGISQLLILMDAKNVIASPTERSELWILVKENLVSVTASTTFKDVVVTNALMELSICSAQVFMDASLAIVTLVDLEDKFVTK